MLSEMSTPLETLTLAKFSAVVQTRFRVQTGPGSETTLELVQANPSDAPAGPAGKEARGESFMLLFHDPGDRMLPQGTYPFVHDELGAFDLFIVPIGQAPGVFQYQAVFNRVR
jgi:hypothetical protein